MYTFDSGATGSSPNFYLHSQKSSAVTTDQWCPDWAGRCQRGRLASLPPLPRPSPPPLLQPYAFPPFCGWVPPRLPHPRYAGVPPLHPTPHPLLLDVRLSAWDHLEAVHLAFCWEYRWDWPLEWTTSLVAHSPLVYDRTQHCTTKDTSNWFSHVFQCLFEPIELTTFPSTLYFR